jgi:hypothetical protein
MLEGERLRAGADLAVGSDHVHAAESGERARQRLDAGSVDAIVVGHQDQRGRHLALSPMQKNKAPDAASGAAMRS